MSAPSSVGVPYQVNPQETVELSVDLAAPSSSGTYRANFQMVDESGNRFGDIPYVRIVVPVQQQAQQPPAPSQPQASLDATIQVISQGAVAQVSALPLVGSIKVSPSDQDGVLRITVDSGNSGYICGLYISPSSDSSWGSNWLQVLWPSDPTLWPGDWIEFGVSYSAPYDIRVEHCEGDVYEEFNLNIAGYVNFIITD